jgi:hypothetical protein
VDVLIFDTFQDGGGGIDAHIVIADCLVPCVCCGMVVPVVEEARLCHGKRRAFVPTRLCVRLTVCQLSGPGGVWLCVLEAPQNKAEFESFESFESVERVECVKGGLESVERVECVKGGFQSVESVERLSHKNYMRI